MTVRDTEVRLTGLEDRILNNLGYREYEIRIGSTVLDVIPNVTQKTATSFGGDRIQKYVEQLGNHGNPVGYFVLTISRLVPEETIRQNAYWTLTRTDYVATCLPVEIEVKDSRIVVVLAIVKQETASNLAPTVASVSIPTVTGVSQVPTVIVTYVATYGIDINTISNGNVTLGNLTPASYSVSGNTVTYTFQIPGGSWTSSENGTYAASVVANSVKSLSGVFLGATSLGNLTVNVPAINTPGTLTVTGTATFGQTLTATLVDPDGFDVVNYQWQYYNGNSWVNISGATNSSYVIGNVAVTHQVRCVATYTDLAGFSENPISNSTDPVLDTINNSIATNLPFLSSGRIAHYANLATLTNPDDPAKVIRLLASGDAVVSGHKDDGSLYTSNDRSIAAVTNGVNVGSIWNLNANTRFLNQATVGSQPVTNNDFLLINAGRFISLDSSNYNFTNNTTIQRIAGYRAMSRGIHENFTNWTSSLPDASNLIRDRFGANVANTNSYNQLETSFVTHVRFFAGNRLHRFNGAQISDTVQAVAGASTSLFAIGRSAVTGTGSSRLLFMWIKNMPLDTADYLLVEQFILRFCGVI